ncbi:hypothetical protein V2S08_25635, partial [Escherichia coli]|nr:hypothetical protein [Escherichia coli]
VDQRAVEIEHDDGGRGGGHHAFRYRAAHRDARADAAGERFSAILAVIDAVSSRRPVRMALFLPVNRG